MECHGESHIFLHQPTYVICESRAYNVIDYIVCPSFSLTCYYRPVCAITNTNE